MKKLTLALTILLSLGLTACSTNKDKNTYRGEVLSTEIKGDNVKLTIRQNDCKNMQGHIPLVTVVRPYDSNLVVGACVRVSKNKNDADIKNISRSKSSSALSRTGKY